MSLAGAVTLLLWYCPQIERSPLGWGPQDMGDAFSTSPSSISSFHHGVCFLLLGSGIGTLMRGV